MKVEIQVEHGRTTKVWQSTPKSVDNIYENAEQYLEHLIRDSKEGMYMNMAKDTLFIPSKILEESVIRVRVISED